jgi:hypothetical protein
MTSDSQNMDAQNSGECVIQCQISASYTNPPERVGLDAVIVLDNCVCGRKLELALDVARKIVEGMVSSDRLGLVVGGGMVSQLIMCTLPYKIALQKSIREVRCVEGDLWTGLRIAGELLAKEARNGGHVFLISDGQLFGEQTTLSLMRTTVHVIAVGALVNEKLLRQVRGLRGVYVEFREGREFEVDAFLRCLGRIQDQGIETVRCRFEHPEEVSVTSVFPQSLALDPTLSLTLRKFPSLNPAKHALAIRTPTPLSFVVVAFTLNILLPLQPFSTFYQSRSDSQLISTPSKPKLSL